MKRVSFIFVLLIGAGLAGPHAADHVPAVVSGQERARVEAHTLQLRIEPDRRAPPGSCLNLTAADLDVRLRGDRVEDPSMVDLDRQPHPTLHGLLIDSSSSMLGKMDYVRQVAADYVETLRFEDERAIVVGFDETVTLHQSATSDKQLLVRGIDRIHMSNATSLNDGLVYLIRELATHRERPVVVLVSDGFDVTSLSERDDVFAAVAETPGITVFTIGLALPPLMQGGPPGFLTIRRFLQRLAARTNGEFFDSPTRSRLPGIYRRIREMLDNEAILTVFDPNPEFGPPRLVVKSRRGDCKIRVFKEPKEISIPDRNPQNIESKGLPRELVLEPAERFRNIFASARKRVIDPECSAADGWAMTVEPNGMRGCFLDVTLDYGPLYDATAGMYMNRWIGLKTRPIHIPLSNPDDLPGRPEMLMDRLGAHAVRMRDDEIERDWRCWPGDEHARPFHDYPALVSGRVFLDLRRDLARGLFLHPAYRKWAQARLDQEADDEIEAIVRRLRTKSPSSSTEVLIAAARQSEQGLQVLARKSAPADVDLQRHLATWLGDIPAHDLFVRWEAGWIERALAGTVTPADQDGFVEAWEALRQVFYLPCYARTLTLLSPLHDPDTGRIGFWRVVLPRAGWFLPRRKGYKHHPEFNDVPMDLIPDRPLGIWLSRHLFENAPDLARHFARRDYQVVSVSYALRGKSGHHDPHRAFRSVRVVLTLSMGDGVGPPVEIAADIGTRNPKRAPELYVESLNLGPTKDEELRRLFDAARREKESRREARVRPSPSRTDLEVESRPEKEPTGLGGAVDARRRKVETVFAVAGPE